MQRLIVPPKQAAAAFLLALAASLAIALLASPASPAAPGIPGEVSGEYSSDCVQGGDIIDPVGVLFTGAHASAQKSAFEVTRAAEWTYEGLGNQKLKVKAKGDYECKNVDVQPASEPDYRLEPGLPVFDIPDERFHVRMWFIPASRKAADRKTVGTPHHEDFEEYNLGLNNHCRGAVHLTIRGVDLWALGGHAVDKGGVDTGGGGSTGEDSGFDQGRQELRRSMENTAHKVDTEKWGNDTRIEQCDEDWAGSNGNGIVVGMEWVKSGFTNSPHARQSSARLQGRLTTTEKSTEWWFEYGPSSSVGAGTYPKKTPVKSVSEATEVDVQQPIAGLSPGSTYYVRMFVRDKEGGIEEGNEVKFETCGYEDAGEDDGSKGPRAATPECGGPVDTFYRDVNGDLGRQSWSPEGDWSTETRPASIARGAIPRVVPRSDGSRTIDVFYREVDGDLGHHWHTPGSGWQEDVRDVSMASDPNVVTQPNGTIDVFYRTTGGQLGHEWWTPGSGWSSEVRPTTLSSDPHAVAHKDGSIDVVYRTGSNLGRDNWTPKNGWTHEVRSGSLVGEPRPIGLENSVIDIFYRTSSNKLAHDFFVPGVGWARENRTESLISDPQVVKRPDGTYDVFYRTPGDELGHLYWVSGSGWATEIRPGHLSSDPQVVARSNGTVEVFYRDGNRIGHQWHVPGTGWSVESRRGPIAWHTDPSVVVQTNGRIDVLYETPTGQLGRDFYAPGAGWGHEIRPTKRPSRPVAAYSFETGAGSVAEDVVGNHDGTLEGAKWFDRGKFGKALLFDGEETCVTVPHAADLQLSEEMTVEAWVKPHYLSDQPVIYKSAWGNLGYALGIDFFNPAKPEGLIGEGPGKYEDVVSSQAVEENVWSHLAFSYDGATMRLYVNGELVGSQAQSTPPPTGQGPLAIGCNPLYPEDFEGLIDEVRIYDRALDAGEIGADKGAPLATPARPPVAAYSFEAGEGELAEDAAGNNDGTIEGAEWFDRGKFGSALYFDGTTDLVTVPDSNQLDLTDEFTLQAWVRPDEANEWSSVITKEREGNLSYQMHAEGEGEAPVGYVENSEDQFEVEAGDDPIPVKVWSHLALVYDGAKLRYYINGELKGTSNSGDAAVSADPLLIGSNITWGEEDSFKGLIDEIRIYDRALDEGELAADKATPIRTPSRGPVAAYSFEAGQGEVAEDWAGGHDGTLKNTEWTPGRYGKALYLDGNSDYVEIPDHPELQLTEEFTLESWVRPDGVEDEGAVISKTAGNFYSYQLYAGSRESAGIPEGFLGYGSWAWEDVEDETPLKAKTWNHLALTYDGGNLRLYVNGELVSSEENVPAGMASAGPLYLGGNEGEEDFKGRIDEVRIYDRALDAGEINADKATPLETPARPAVAAYSFETGAGSVAEDVVGNHDGTLEGAEWFDNGKFGKALLFDGEETCVTVPHAADLQLSEEMTVEAWVKPHDLSDQPILYKSAWGFPGYALGISFFNTATPEGFIGEGEGAYEDVVSSQTVEENVWSHLAFTYDGATMRLYVNGELVGSQAQPTSPPTGQGPLAIGCNPLYPEDFEGLIDEIRIYDRALDAGQIGADKAAPLETPARPPVASYSFDAGQGAVAEDSAGGHDGTLEGATWFGKGKFGSALSFDGENDCVSVPDAEELRITEELTVEAWVRPRSLSGQPVVFKDSYGFKGHQLAIGLYETGKAEAFLGEGYVGKFDRVAGAGSLATDVWSHLAFTFDGGQMRLYVNGDLVDAKVHPAGMPWAEGDLAIGCNPLYSPERFDGLIDEVRIYDRALSEAEVEADMKGNRS